MSNKSKYSERPENETNLPSLSTSNITTPHDLTYHANSPASLINQYEHTRHWMDTYNQSMLVRVILPAVAAAASSATAAAMAKLQQKPSTKVSTTNSFEPAGHQKKKKRRRRRRQRKRKDCSSIAGEKPTKDFEETMADI